MRCTRCHERDVTPAPGAARLSFEAREECRRVLGFDVEEFLEEIAATQPRDVCGACLKADPALRHRVEQQLEDAFSRLQGKMKLVPFFLLRELLGRQVLRGMDIADRLVQRFRKAPR